MTLGFMATGRFESVMAVELDLSCLCLDPSPQADCEDCEGTGLIEVPELLDSRFDYFGLGGRWEGAFDATGAGRDIIPIADLVPGKLPAVVTLPDGSWFVDVDLNDGSENSTEPDAPRTVNVRSAKWAACVAGLLRDDGDCIVIVTDMHA